MGADIYFDVTIWSYSGYADQEYNHFGGQT
jgi:hypothetical protein